MSFFIIIFLKSWWERKSATKKEGEATKERSFTSSKRQGIISGEKKRHGSTNKRVKKEKGRLTRTFLRSVGRLNKNKRDQEALQRRFIIATAIWVLSKSYMGQQVTQHENGEPHIQIREELYRRLLYANEASEKAKDEGYTRKVGIESMRQVI